MFISHAHTARMLAVLAILLTSRTLATAFEPVRVSFELHNDHIYLRTKVNGKGPYYFLFDTGAGASGSMIDGAVAKRLKLPVAGQLNAGMIGGSRGLSFTGAVTYTVGGLTFHEEKTAFMPLKEQEKDEHHRIDGIFGYSLIRRYVVEINYGRHIITFYDPAKYTKPARGVRLGLHEIDKDKVPMVAGKVTSTDGRLLDLNLIVDTGYDGTLLLGRGFVEANGLAAKQNVSTGAGLGGSTSLQKGEIKRLHLGELTIDGPETVFAFDKQGNFAGEHGFLGGRFLNRRTLVLNYHEGYLLLI
jgi:hypothetical protein